MTTKITTSQFISMLRNETNLIKKKLLQVRFSIANEIKIEAKQNVTDTFGRGSGNTARTAGRSGALRDSIDTAFFSDGSVGVEAGGPGVPYAAIQEFGGTITPKNVNWLTIPLSQRFFGRRASEFNDLFFINLRNVDKYGHPMGMLIDRTTEDAAYLLLKETRIPARPYLQPAVDKVVGDKNKLIAIHTESFNSGSQFGYKVTTE